jgi:hypothetical protein
MPVVAPEDGVLDRDQAKPVAVVDHRIFCRQLSIAIHIQCHGHTREIIGIGIMSAFELIRKSIAVAVERL